MDAVRHDVAAAIYTFAGWLTCRDEPITASRTNDAAPMANLVDEFCKTNGIPDPDMAASGYKHPCTGEGREMAAAARRQWFASRDFTPVDLPIPRRILIALALALLVALKEWTL